ncbi:hypothetical protein [Actinacidiphila acididurans]|uniref:Uncharacterized protein n=1 Tax=Actinacidiphila acididurans TaxID=2784346 RepID=A0ABS2U356_9ACTN|nr:hypothetical protein [Actinacidiphila acididurans]MBM9510034.1 hypothetical protein [Actinacidiphila acididurans]
MAVLTHAYAPTTDTVPTALATTAAPTARTVRADAIDPADLGPEQAALASDALWELGIEDGLVVNGGGNPYVDLRRARSAAAAAVIGLHLGPADELAQCGPCRRITADRNVHEADDGVLRCTLPDPDGATCHDKWLDSL